MNLRVTLAQVPVDTDIQKNLLTLKTAVKQASDDRSDILLTPEGSLSGYTHLFDDAEARDALFHLTAYARSKRVGLALGTCFYEDDGVCYDELRFYLPDGAYLGCHTKTLLCGTVDGDPPKGEVEHYGVMPLRVFDYMGLTIGGMVCNDMWANPMCTPADTPNPARLLARMGAKVIFHAVNGGRDASLFSQVTVKRFHESHVLMNARAFGVHIATVDNAFPTDTGVSSVSGVVSPKGWDMRIAEMGWWVKSHTIIL